MSPDCKAAMKAVYWSLTRDGNIYQKVLILENYDSVPEPEATEVQVHVKACGLSDVDIDLLQELGLLQQKLPWGQQIAGIVTKVGSSVTRFKIGEEVAGILPLDSRMSGCAEYCIISEYNLVCKPNKVSFHDVAACIGEGVKMYTALRYLGHVCGGDTVLVLDGAKPAGLTGVQLAQSWGAKVIASAATEEERLTLEALKPELAHVIDTSKPNRFAILNECLEDTGALGVDCIIDNGVNMYPNEVDESGQVQNSGTRHIGQRSLPEKHEVISTLGVGGRWVTSQRDLQLDPPDSKLLQMKGASVCFLNDTTWTMASHKQGKYLHILRDIMQKLEQGVLRPPETHTLSLDDICGKYINLSTSAGCRKIVMQLQ